MSALAATSTELESERGLPALFSWGDVDGDGRLDLAAVNTEGKLQLLANADEGRFEDITEQVGLAGIQDAALALWADYDGDGRLDLFVGAREGASRLFHNEGGVFADMTAASGLNSEGAVQSAYWLDHDADGRPDLFIVTAQKSELFRGFEGGFFDAAELPLTAGVETHALGGLVASVDRSAPPPVPGSIGGLRPGHPTRGIADVDGVNPSGNSIPFGLPPNVGSVTPISVFPTGCATSLKDQANPGTCLTASTTPTLGRLYPISSNLFVAVGGNVGIGTTSPAAKLHVAGTARLTDTLTLAPAGDQALDVSTGSIYKSGALFIHTKGTFNTAVGQDAMANVTTGLFNTALGERALENNTTGDRNTASGFFALRNNTTGFRNTANGYRALENNTTGKGNTANGARALTSNTSGIGNTAAGYRALVTNIGGYNNTVSGYEAMYSNTYGGRNTAIGFRALFAHTTGLRNIALGHYAGSNLTTGSNNIAIGNYGVAGEGATIRVGTAGTHTRTFIGGIRGATTGVANAIPVLIDSAGQLGTVSSSRRFKKDIADMGDATERLLELRPVVFHYKQEQTLPNGGEVPLEYGLIAEEVAEIFPDLVVYDEDGLPFTVKYHLLSSMLLNELKKQHEELEAQRGKHAREMEELRSAQEKQRREFDARLAALEARTSPAPLPASPSDTR